MVGYLAQSPANASPYSANGFRLTCALTRLLLKPKNNARRNSPVILRRASEPRQQIVPLNDPPADSLLDFSVHSSSDCHCKRRIPESPRAEMRPAQQHVRKRRYLRRQRHLRSEQEGMHRLPNSELRSIVPVEVRHSSNPVPEFVLHRGLPPVQIHVG